MAALAAVPASGHAALHDEIGAVMGAVGRSAGALQRGFMPPLACRQASSVPTWNVVCPRGGLQVGRVHKGGMTTARGNRIRVAGAKIRHRYYYDDDIHPSGGRTCGARHACACAWHVCRRQGGGWDAVLVAGSRTY